MKKVFLFWFVFCGFVGQVHANGFEQKMDVSIGVFDAATIVLDYKATPAEYQISAEVKTANFFDTLYPFVGRYSSKGSVFETKGKVRDILPETYQTYTKSRNHVRTKTILYNDEGYAYQRISIKDENKNVVPITGVPKTADAADLQTIFAELIGNFNQTRSCLLEREVYDGKKHYKVIAQDQGTENRYFNLLKRTENSYKCSFYIENLKDNNDNILWDVSAETPIYFWIGIDQVSKLPYVLEIRIDSTPLGALKVIPTSLKIK